MDLDLDGTTNHLLTANDDARFSDEISMVFTSVSREQLQRR
jgi:hypothetical protein